MTRSDLKAITKKELESMAREHQIPGWHSMRKSELVDRLAVHFRRKARTASVSAASKKTKPTAVTPRNFRLSTSTANAENGQMVPKDRLVVDVRDSHWLHVRWDLSPAILGRAEAAMGVEWRQAEPVLRVFDVTEQDETVGTKSFVKDVEIVKPLNNWYVPIDEPGRTYRLQLGYRAPSGNFFVIARSPKVKSPKNGSLPVTTRRASNTDSDTVAADHIHDEIRPTHNVSTNGNGHHKNGDVSKDHFAVDAEIVVYGQTHPLAQLSLLGKPVQQQHDGRFSIRLSLEDGRQVIPAVCITPNGCEQRTIVLAIERNTKQLETLSLDEMD